MFGKIKKNIFEVVNELQEKIESLEKSQKKLRSELNEALKLQSFHLLKIKNGLSLSDDHVINKRKYSDLSPRAAAQIYADKDKDFILLNVSKKSYSSHMRLKEALDIPLEEINFRINEITNKASYILVISEDGTRSILACEILYNYGFLNLNNISGGFKFWHKNTQDEEASQYKPALDQKRAA